MRFNSPAKINLGLEVLRRRNDGFHEIGSVMLAVDLCDRVSVRIGDDEDIVDSGEGFSRTKLTDQALDAYFKTARIQAGFSAEVKKNIPIAAGLGGGSSNAAIALLAANLHSGHALSESELAEVASQIGSDVPFFLSGGCALVSGRGEIRTRDLPVPNVWIVLANPGVKLSTPDVFGEFRRSEFTSGARTRVLAASLAAGQPHWHLLYNGLQAAAERLCPQIREALAALRAHTPWTLLSGSGATCLGVVETQDAAVKAGKDLARAGYWSWAGRPLESWTLAELQT